MLDWFKRKAPEDYSHILLGDEDETPRAQPPPFTSASQQPDDDEIDPIMIEAAMEATNEVDYQEQLTGVKFTPEQRQSMLQLRGTTIALTKMADRTRRQEAQGQADELRQAIDSMNQAVANSKQDTAFGAVKEVWREHPFLFGLLGAAAVHKIKRHLPDKR